ncbi:MAG TPA: hypothetical protein RMG95_03530, partial [Polyangiaceae bacterium LLY-WYZ-15_(1-7)]|nr:hypothetical protein [Polyangiaceae bacterium LLY-WYZ-15_(1-7)]
PAPSGSLLDALRRVAAASGFEGEDAILELAAAGVEDAALADALAGVLDAVAVALEEREAALARIDDRARYYEGPSGLLAPGLRGLDLRRADDRGALRGDVDVGRLAGAARGLARAIEAAALERFAGQGATFTLDTPAGRVAVRGGGDHVYDEADWAETLLLVDLGGDDTYRFPAGATTGPAHGVALVVDVGGADDYGYVAVPDPQDEGPEGHARLPSDGAGRREPGESNGPSSLSTTARQGAGLLGVGMLVDLGTAPDRYRSLRMSQGYGALGVGLLYDAGGDDVYAAEALAQGAAAFGLGLLVDEGGADRYVAYTMAQGFAYARAVGVLEERGGDDEYLLHPSDVLYWSAQDPGASNSSLGQGMGFGRRADFLPDRVFMSGGLGVLHDASGADRYTAAIFAQGSGFWFGTGLLLEDGGDDRYDGQWYVQGGAAHFAVAALLEGGGDDDYNALARRQNVVFGGGHDFSVAWLVERAGADVYRGPGLSFGSGNQAGAGLFVDVAGADRYDATRDFGFGDASVRSDDAFRRSEGTFGVFLEADGVDEYVRPTVAPLANDARWTQRQHEGEGSEQGVGIDATGAAPGI